MIKKFVICAVLVLCVGVSQAGVITWGSAQDTTTSAVNDIVDGGDVVLAYNGHNLTTGPGDVVLFYYCVWDEIQGQLVAMEKH